MTQNTIAYANYLENKRANIADETETQRSNKANENIKVMNLTETIRSNKATEKLKDDSNKETKRANVAQEKLKRSQNKETRRSNIANEKIKRQANNIQKKLGNKQLKEMIRSNKVNESIKKIANSLTKIRDEETKLNNAKKIQLEYDKLLQQVSENAKDRKNAELIAYIRRLGEEMATAGFLAMKGEQYSSELTDLMDKAEQTSKDTPGAIKLGSNVGKKTAESISKIKAEGSLGLGAKVGKIVKKAVNRVVGKTGPQKKKAASQRGSKNKKTTTVNYSTY